MGKEKIENLAKKYYVWILFGSYVVFTYVNDFIPSQGVSTLFLSIFVCIAIAAIAMAWIANLGKSIFTRIMITVAVLWFIARSFSEYANEYASSPLADMVKNLF